MGKPYKPPTVLVLCAGREGDDEILALRAGETLTPELLKSLVDVLAIGAWMQESEGPDTQKKPFRARVCKSFKALCSLAEERAKEKQNIYFRTKGKSNNEFTGI